jgi:hypothetical protein
MANILTIPESGIYFDGNTAGGADIPILTGNASAVSIQYDGYAGIEVNSSATGANYLDRFSVEGANGRLFGVTDEVTGTVFSVNDAAGLPIIEVESTADHDKITIGEYGTNALVVSGDSVGIGTASPTEKLDVVGNIKASGTVTASNIGTIAAFEGNQNLRTTDPATFSIAKAQALLPSSAQDLFQLSSNDGTVRFRAGITSGNSSSMIIGTQYTSLATAALVVDNGNGNCALFGRGTAYTAEVSFAGNIPQFRLQNNGKTFTASVSGNTFRISDGASPGTNDRLTISSAGDVGVTNLTASGTVTAGGVRVDPSSGEPAIQMVTASGTVKGITLTSENDMFFPAVHGKFDYSVGLRGQRGSVCGLEAGASGYDLVVSSAGTTLTVGGGTCSKVAIIKPLEVTGNITASGTVTAGGLAVEGQLSTGTSQFNVLNTEGGNFIFRSGIVGVSNNGASFLTANIDGSGGATRMVISSIGKVGIGTTTPAEKLDVVGNILATSFKKSGGSSGEFLKADGSVDSNSYLTSLGTAILDGDFTVTGLMKRTGAGTYTSITDNSSNWNTAYTDRNKWDGGATGLNAATGRASLGLGSAATVDSSEFATADQGTSAETAFGWGDHASAGYATLANPALTGTPTAPTAAANTNTTQIATTAYVQTELSDLISAAPAALDTLNELAAALGDDANFSTTVTNSIAAKLPLAGGTMTGPITTNSTFDGRNVSVDGTKLDTIETGATADQTDAEIRAAVEAATDSNVFTDADHSKLNAIEAGATADQSAAEILTAIKTVDGSGSGLDADLLDGVSSASFLRSDISDDSYRISQAGHGVPVNNLGSPSLSEMALHDEQFNNKTEFYPIANLKFYTSTDGSTWTEYTSFSDTNKRKFLGGDASSGIVIPNGTAHFRIELINNGNYVALNSLYMYWSSNSHNTTVKIRKQRGDGVWSQHTNSSATVSSWPGHLYLPFTSIWFNPSTTSTDHHRTVHFDFQPTWSTGAYSSTDINLYKFQVWGGYPAGKRNVYGTDENKNVTFPEVLAATGGNSTNWNTAYTVANAALPKAGGAMTGPITTNSTFDGRNVSVDGTKLDTIATSANNYSLPAGTSSERGGFKIGYSENGKNYPVEVSSEQMFVTVPWADADTTYSAGAHLSLSGTTFNLNLGVADAVLNIGHNSISNEGEIVLDTSNAGSPQISFTEHGDASWAIGVDDADNSFKIHGVATSVIPTINGLATPLFEIATNGLGYLGANRLFADNYHPNADTLTTARTISLAGAVTGSVSFNGSSDVSITTTATADPTLTLSGDASGSATFTNLGNATLSVTIADDSHNHIISNIDGLQVALDAKAPLANPALTGIPTAPTPSAGTSSTQIATTAFVNSYFVSNRLETPVQNFNPWGVNKFYHGVETNRFHGRSEFLSLSVDGGSASAPSIYLTEGGYENSAGVYGTVGGSDVVLLYDFETNGLTGVNGFTYASGQFHIHFYYGRHPTAITARVKDRNDSWTSMTMTGYGGVGNYISWRGTVPIYNYITAVEFTLTPQGTGGNTISLTELEYHGTRMGLSEGGLLTKNGGDIFGNLNVSGNVGIGTTSPDAALHVAGAIPIAPTGSGVLMGLQSNYGIVHLNGSTGGILDFSSSGVDRKGRILYDNAGNYMQIQTNGSDKVRIDSSGNVGIGTTTPSAKLEVAGSSKFLGTTHHSWFNNGSSEDTFIRGGKATSKVYINDSHSADVVIASGGGKVGIGTTAPEGKLHVWGGNAGAVVAEGEADDLIVENGSSGGVSILVPDSSNSNIRFGSPSVNSGALLRWNYNDGLMTAGTNKAGAGYRIMTGSFVEALRVASTGNVGIGTTSPMGKLHVSAGSAGTYTPTATTQFIIEDDQSTGITIANPDGSTGHLYFGSPSRQIGALISHSFGSAKMTIGTGYTGHEVSILSGNSVEAIRVNSTGSVGIGTTTPAEKLDVVGNILATSFKKSGGSSSEFLKADGSVDSNSYLTSLGTAILDGDFTVSGLMKRTGVGTYASITDNSSNWNTAYGWGNHASAGYATLANPALTGTPTAPTAAANTNTTQIATTAYVQTELSDLISAAPAALDTLNELAAALGDDANFSTTVTNSIAAKLPLSGGTMTGDLIVEDSEIHVGDKSNDQWTRFLHAAADGYGFDWQHNNATVIVNEQGSTNQVMVLGDVDDNNAMPGLFGIAHSANSGTSWTKKLDLRGDGDLYIGSSGTSKVFHDGYHPNADTLTTSRTISLTGNVTGSVSFDGSSNVSISTSLAADSVGSTEIAANAVGASELNVSGNGTNTQFLRSNADGTFTWAVPTDTNTVYTHPTYVGDDFSVDSGPLTGATVISDIDINVTTDTLGHVTDANGTIATRTLTAADLGITAPNAPTSVTSTIVGQTIDLTFNASSTSNIDAYLVYSSVDGSDYGLIQVIPPADFSSTMSVIDTAFTHTGTQAYRVYAMKYGILSSAGTASVSYTVSSAEPSNVEVINMNNAYYVQWNPPSTNARFVTSYNVFKHEASTAGALLRASASLVYSGLNTNYMYQINGNNNNNFHQFWVETTIA